MCLSSIIRLFYPLPSNKYWEYLGKRRGTTRVERGAFSPLFPSYDPFSSRFLVAFCHLRTHLTASLRGQNVSGGEVLLLCTTFTCLQHPILLYYTCCIKTGTTENLFLPTTRESLCTRLGNIRTLSHKHTHKRNPLNYLQIQKEDLYTVMWYRAVRNNHTDISDERTASIFKTSQANKMLSWTFLSKKTIP